MTVSSWKRFQQASGWPFNVAVSLAVALVGPFVLWFCIYGYFWVVRATAALLVAVTS